MFQPPRCPYPGCPRHFDPGPNFVVRIGRYFPLCRNHPEQRFRCRFCHRTFSRQTCRADYRRKKPHLNAACLRLRVSCVGFRQAAQVLQVARRTIERRFAWLARHVSDWHINRLGGALLEGTFQLDELESFEANRYQPVTVPVLIDRGSLFIVAPQSAPAERAVLAPLQRVVGPRRPVVERRAGTDRPNPDDGRAGGRGGAAGLPTGAGPRLAAGLGPTQPLPGPLTDRLPSTPSSGIFFKVEGSEFLPYNLNLGVVL